MILAWTGPELSSEQTSDWHTDWHTHTQTQTTTIPVGQYWPRVKRVGFTYYTKDNQSDSRCDVWGGEWTICLLIMVHLRVCVFTLHLVCKFGTVRRNLLLFFCFHSCFIHYPSFPCYYPLKMFYFEIDQVLWTVIFQNCGLYCFFINSTLTNSCLPITYCAIAHHC